MYFPFFPPTQTKSIECLCLVYLYCMGRERVDFSYIPGTIFVYAHIFVPYVCLSHCLCHEPIYGCIIALQIVFSFTFVDVHMS